MDIKPKTIICDIDGTLVEHVNPATAANISHDMKLLPGTLKKLMEWEANGFNIILLTGRKESMRIVTETQLSKVGIFYDQLIMGVGGGIRVLINDNKPNGDIAALSINVERNKGINDIIL